MSSFRVLFAGVALAFCAATFAACSSPSSPAAPIDDPVLAEGQKIYTQNCASCHGASGGGGYGKKLAGVVATNYPNIDDQIALIANGKGGMPAFGKKLSPEQLTAVARYTREVLGTN